MFLFRAPYDKQHRMGDLTLLKPEQHHLYHIDWSMWRQLSWKKSPLVIYKILGLFVKTLNTGHKYSLLNRENLKKPIQMKLSQKQNLFSQFVSAFLKSRLNFKHFQKKMTVITDVFRKLRTAKTWLNKCLKSPVSEDPSTSNMVTGVKQCWNLNDTNFTTFSDHSEGYWVTKNLSWWYTKS